MSMTRDELILSFQPLVVKAAMAYARSTLELDDRISIGNIALIEAVDRYPPERKLYKAVIRNRLRSAFRDKARVDHNSVTRRDGFPDYQEPPDIDDEGEHLHSIIMDALNKDEYQYLLTYYGLSPKEVMVIHGISKSLASYRAVRLVAKVRREYARRHDPLPPENGCPGTHGR